MERGLGIIKNCAAIPSLRPAVRCQAEGCVTLYTDPYKNTVPSLTESIVILTGIGATGSLAGREWPDSLFDSLSDLIARTEYHEESQLYRVTYRQDDTGMWVPVDNIMIVLLEISTIPDYVCKMASRLGSHRCKLRQILTLGNESNKKSTRDVLETLKRHNCEHCQARKWASELLGQK